MEYLSRQRGCSLTHRARTPPARARNNFLGRWIFPCHISVKLVKNEQSEGTLFSKSLKKQGHFSFFTILNEMKKEGQLP